MLVYGGKPFTHSFVKDVFHFLLNTLELLHEIVEFTTSCNNTLVQVSSTINACLIFKTCSIINC